MTTPAPPAASAASTPDTALALHDARPFFEKALRYGVQHGMLDAAKLAAINAEAPKGMVQIARYFGSEFLRPELEKARERMVNLVGLYLQESCDSDLALAAQSLRDHSLLSRSKGGSDMLKRLIALPESSHFALGGYADAQTPLLAVWSLRSHGDYRAELVRRSRIAQAMDAAVWLAAQYELDAEALEEAGTDAEAVIRTALLWRALAPRAVAWPSAAALEKALAAQRKKTGAGAVPALALPRALPPELRSVVEAECPAVLAEWPRLLDAAQPLRPLLRPLGRFRARFFLCDDPLSEVDDHYRSLGALEDDQAPAQPASKTWLKATQGNEDEHALLTLFVCLAAGAPKKTLLTEKTAASLVRKIRKSGFHPELATAFIHSHAPGAFQSDYTELWNSFVQESQQTLCSDLDYQLHDALALLRRECHVAE